MRLIDHLTSHPLLEERPVRQVFEPLGFDVHLETQDPPVDPHGDKEAFERFARDPVAYMESLPFDIPDGYTDMGRWETEDEIVMLAVKPTTALAELLLAQEETAEPLAAIAGERRRQVEAEGWAPEHDDSHANGEMAVAAGFYALINGWPYDRPGALGTSLRGCPSYWPWDAEWWKPSTAWRNLKKSSALTLAEMERIKRTEGGQS